jgi:peptide-methionine (S)-S-oxide reductase
LANLSTSAERATCKRSYSKPCTGVFDQTQHTITTSRFAATPHSDSLLLLLLAHHTQRKLLGGDSLLQFHKNMCLGYSPSLEQSAGSDHVGDSSLVDTATPGSIVTLELSLIPENGFVPEPLFDTTGTISFVLRGGHYLPGLHELVLEQQCRVGDVVDGVSIDAGWGARRDDLILTVARAKLVAALERQQEQQQQRSTSQSTASTTSSSTEFHTGMTLQLQGGIKVVIVSMDDETVVLDANPPLAGTSYACSLTVKEIHALPECLDWSADIAASMSSPVTTQLLSPENNKLLAQDEVGSTGNLANVRRRHDDDRYEVATFALGCFWGAELAFMRTRGVVGTQVGYTHGVTSNPAYEEVCAGTTHHCEAIQVIYDSTVVSYSGLLEVATERLQSATTPPSPLDLSRLFREGDETKQYRHGFFYHSAEQQTVAKEYLASVEGSNNNRLGKIDLLPATTFWKAEDWHQQYLYKGGQSARKGSQDSIRCYG